METNALVGVWANHYDEEGFEKWQFATGYAVAPDRILTVRHVLNPRWSEIHVAAMHLKEPLTKAIVKWPAIEKGQGYQDADDLDAILLEWQFPPQFPQTRPRLKRFLPRDAVKWMSNCFPDAMGRERDPSKGPPDYFDAFGHFNPPREGVRVFPINCEQKGLPPRAWRGASGGPLCEQSGTASLVGIIKADHLRKLEGVPDSALERLMAVPMWENVAAEGIDDALGGISSEEQQQQDFVWRKRRNTLIQFELSQIADREVIRHLA
ncbi:MAG: hypothetical protein H7210_11965, partial [Pyrinomonadaceae bacterium]|nr:hypothetical protein [Phycisphaerales bacterium]